MRASTTLVLCGMLIGVTGCSVEHENLLHNLPDDVRIAFYESDEYGEPVIDRVKYPPFDSMELPPRLEFIATYRRETTQQHWTAFSTLLDKEEVLGQIE